MALSLPATIGARQIVTVSYAVPATGTVIADTAGNEAVGFEDFPVTNNSTVANTTPPVPASGEVVGAGDTLTLTFNEDLDIAPVGFPRPAPSPSRPTASRWRCRVFVGSGFDTLSS